MTVEQEDMGVPPSGPGSHASTEPDGLDPSGFDPSRFQVLSERCEAANGPDRALDGDIWVAIHGPALWVWAGTGTPMGAPFTASVDAAVTLIPPTWRVDFIQQALDEPYWICRLYRRTGKKHVERVESVSAESMALAICSAALLAIRDSGKHPKGENAEAG